MKAIGNAGEQVVSDWLESKGYNILARNWRAVSGEIDIIVQKNGEIVFVEVKTLLRTNLESLDIIINNKKQAKICRTAKYFLQKNRQYNSMNMRFDVVVLRSNPFFKKPPEIFHIEHAFGDCNE